MSNWYYADAERQRQGPLTAEELTQRFHQGRLRLDTLVWRDGLAEWQPLRAFTDELALHQAPAEIFYNPVEAAATPAAAATTAGAASDTDWGPTAATATVTPAPDSIRSSPASPQIESSPKSVTMMSLPAVPPIETCSPPVKRM